WELQGDPVQEFRGGHGPPFVLVKQFHQLWGNGFKTIVHHGPGRGPFVQVDEHIAKIQNYVLNHFCIWIGYRPIYIVCRWAFPRPLVRACLFQTGWVHGRPWLRPTAHPPERIAGSFPLLQPRHCRSISGTGAHRFGGATALKNPRFHRSVTPRCPWGDPPGSTPGFGPSRPAHGNGPEFSTPGPGRSVWGPCRPSPERSILGHPPKRSRFPPGSPVPHCAIYGPVVWIGRC